MYKIRINKEKNKVNLKKKVSIRQRQQRKPFKHGSLKTDQHCAILIKSREKKLNTRMKRQITINYTDFLVIVLKCNIHI